MASIGGGVRRRGHLFERVTSFENLLEAHRRARRGKRWKVYAMAFEDRRESEILRLHRELLEQTYRPGRHHTFRIRDPKPRIISAAPYRDRVVHHAVMLVLEPLFDSTFISDTYACRRGKGNHRALLRASYFARHARFVLKMDVRSYFPSIDRDILRALLAAKIKDARLLALLASIIEGPQPTPEMPPYLPGDDLFTPVERRRGIPIGNLTSQFFANVYLSPLDHYVKETLRCKAYVRYVDDMLLFGQDKRSLRQECAAVERFLARRLRVRLHREKTAAVPMRHGVAFLGFRILPEGRRLSHAAKHRQMRRLRELQRAAATGEVDPRRVGDSIRSMCAHAAWGRTRRLWAAALRRHSFPPGPPRRNRRPDRGAASP